MKVNKNSKAWKEFEEWYNENNKFKYDSSPYGLILGEFKGFEKLPFSMQVGVMVDYFEKALNWQVYAKPQGAEWSCYIDTDVSHLFTDYHYEVDQIKALYSSCVIAFEIREEQLNS